MSVQKPQPLIWLARISTSAAVAVGRPKLITTALAALTCLINFAAAGLARKLSRASMVISFAGYTSMTRRPVNM
jgi:hypothetical protein